MPLSIRLPLPARGRPATAASWLAGLVALVAFVGAASPSHAQPRALYWPEFAVEARLDADGKLHVSERQTIQFSGDWNGGERWWDLRPGQQIESMRLTRIDRDTGERRPMIEGDLDVVDGWDWAGRDRLRWRSRMPDDPPFQATVFVYQLDYVMTGVLQPLGDDRYLLDHEFAFANRNGILGELTVELSWNPVWRAGIEPPLVERHERLFSRTSPVTRLELAYTGAGRPAGIPHPLAPLGALLPFVLGFAVIGWLWRDFLRHETASGRYDELPDLRGTPTRAWLDRHVFSRKAEEIGALWDRAVGAPEVSALLARMVAEGRLESWTREGKGPKAKPVLHLRLVTPREELDGYERELVDGLFFDGRTETDTKTVQKHYKKKGFSPAAKIRPGLTEVLPDAKTRPPSARSWRAWLTPALVLLAVVGFRLSLRAFAPELMAVAVPGFLAFTLILGVGLIYALVWRNRVIWPVWTRRWLLVPTLLVAVLAMGMVVVIGKMGVASSWWLLGLAGAVLPVVVASVHLYRARTRESRETVHLRRRLAHARSFFKDELGKGQPALEDDWYPYLLAFGLTEEVEGWSVKHADSGSRVRTTGTGGGFSGGGSSSSGWTGGGGSFGGAGATAAWGSAVAGLSAGVASPSSGGGSGGGGGGGGGGSSGGGGGGGW